MHHSGPALQRALLRLHTSSQNSFLEMYFANQFFGMDLTAVQAVAKQFQTALTASAQKTPNSSDLAPVLARVVLAYQDLWTEIVKAQGDAEKSSGGTPKENKWRSAIKEWSAAAASSKDQPLDATKVQTVVNAYFDLVPQRLLQAAKRNLVLGEIMLSNYKTSAGDVLTVTITAKSGVTVNNSSDGTTLTLQITLDNFGVTAGPSTSLFFLKRIGISASSGSSSTTASTSTTTSTTGSTVPLPVNFVPSPGASFGFTYHYRNYGKCDQPDHQIASDDSNGNLIEHICTPNSGASSKYKGFHPNYMRNENGVMGALLRGLAPGLAMNVSFMNWNSPTDYDPTTGKFTNSPAASIQVGAGFVASLFDNKVQFTYGWKLQVPEKRQYWGVGFGFLEIGKAITGVAKSSSSSSSN